MARDNGDSNDQPSSPAWMTTYGDLMTLLLTFFVLLVTFSSMQKTKFRKALGSLKGHLGVLESQPSMMITEEITIPIFELKKSEAKKLGKAVQEFLKMVENEALKNKIQIKATEKGIAIRLLAPVLFERNSDDLKREAFPILRRIVRVAEVGIANITIDGHTDSSPVGSNFETNWHLSAARAISVVLFMVREGISPNRFTASGHSCYKPAVPNVSDEYMKKNRRVEIFLAYKRKFGPEELSPFSSWDEVYLKNQKQKKESTEKRMKIFD